MKKNLATKIILTAILGSASVSANALIFAQVDAGYGRFYTNNDYEIVFDKKINNKFVPRITLGVNLDDSNRIGVDYTYWGGMSGSKINPGNHKITPHTVGLRYTYTLNTPIVKPYVGVRFNYTHMKYNNVNISNKGYAGYGAMAGVEFKLLPLITFGLGLEYDKLTTHFSGKTLFTSAFIRTEF